MRNYLLILLLFISGTRATLFSQTITINGTSTPSPGAQEYYEAEFDYTLNPYTIINWNVTGGTITSQGINPSSTIWCIVEWSAIPRFGNISIEEDLNSGFEESTIDIGGYSTFYNIVGASANRLDLNCTSITASSCNLIRNNNFTPSTPYNTGNPFEESSVQYWVASHGSPQVDDEFYPSLLPPSPATDFAFMYAGPYGTNNLPNIGEGIAQKIPNLVANNTYKFSFFKRFSKWPSEDDPQLDNFYIVLIDCSDFNSFLSQSNQTPQIPSNSQIIYHETSMTNTNWQYVEITFVANSDFDVIWIFPKQTSGKNASVNFAYPVLVNIADAPTVSPAGPITYYNQYETVQNHVVLTASSSTSYQWYKNNVLIPGAINQTYTVNMNSTTSYVEYYKCVTPCGISNTVTVNYIACDDPSDYPQTVPGNECATNFPYTLTQPSLGTGATYNWWFYSTPSNYSFSNQISNTIQLNSSSYGWGGVYGKSSKNEEVIYMFYSFFTNSGCRTVSTNEGESDNTHKITTNPITPLSYEIKLYPNPASSQVSVTSKMPINKLEIFNSLGILVKYMSGNKLRFLSLPLNDLPNGTYIFKLHSNDGQSVQKLVINR